MSVGLFGAIVVAVITAISSGTLRDVLLDNSSVFERPVNRSNV